MCYKVIFTAQRDKCFEETEHPVFNNLIDARKKQYLHCNDALNYAIIFSFINNIKYCVFKDVFLRVS